MRRFLRKIRMGGAALVLLAGQACTLEFQNNFQLADKEGTAVETREDGSGTIVGKFGVGASGPQSMAAPVGSTIAGASVTIAPGSLSAATEISVGPGHDLATDGTAGTLGIAIEEIEARGTGVEVEASPLVAVSEPMVIVIPLPPEAAIPGALDLNKLIVLYRVHTDDPAKEAIGIIELKDLSVEGGLVKFSATRFGSYQSLVTKEITTNLAEVIIAAGGDGGYGGPADEVTPRVAGLSDQTIDEDTLGADFAFQVFGVDPQSECSALVTPSSSDQTVVTDTSLVVSGSARSCTLIVTPQPDASGVVDIAIDPVATIASVVKGAAFALTITPVNDDPKFTKLPLANVTGLEDHYINLGEAKFVDSDSAIACATHLHASSSSSELVAGADVDFIPTTGGCLIGFQPKANQFGTAILTITIDDKAGGQATSTSAVSITPVNDAPVFQRLPNLQVAEDGAITGLDFRVSDVDSTITCGMVQVGSSDAVVIPLGGISVTGVIPNCKLNVTPAPDRFSALPVQLSFSITDPQLAIGYGTVDVEVTPVNDKPTLNGGDLGYWAVNSSFLPAALVWNDVDGPTGSVSCDLDAGDGVLEASDCTCTFPVGTAVCRAHIYLQPGFKGEASYDIRVSDGLDVSDPATFTLFAGKQFISIPGDLNGYHGLPSGQFEDLYVVPGGSEDTLYAATWGGLAISLDSGATWTAKTTVDGLPSNYVRGVYANGSDVYAATFKGLAMSSDAGANWVPVSLPGASATYSVTGIGADVVVGTNAGVFFRRGTETWQVWNPGYSRVVAANLALTDPNINIYAGGSAGLVKSSSVSFSNFGTSNIVGSDSLEISGVEVFDLARFQNSTTQSFLGAATSLGLYSNWSFGWSAPINASPRYFVEFSADGQSLFSGGDSTLELLPKVLATSSYSSTARFSAMGVGTTDTFLGDTAGLKTFNGSTIGGSTEGIGSFVSNISIDGDTICIATPHGAFRSTDAGLNWIKLSSLVSNQVLCVGSVAYVGTAAGLKTYNGSNALEWTAFAGSTINDIALYAGTMLHLATNSGIQSVSTDNSPAADNGLFSTAPGANSITIIGSTLFAGSGAGIKVAAIDTGTGLINPASWQVVSGLNDDESLVHKLVNDGTYVFAATGRGVIRFDSGGTSPKRMSTTTTAALSSNRVHGVFAHSGKLYAATDDGLAVAAYDSGGFLAPVDVYREAQGLGSARTNAVVSVSGNIFVGTENGLAVSYLRPN